MSDLSHFFTTTDEHGAAELRYAADPKDAVGEFVCDADGMGLDYLVRRANDFTPQEES
jgi:hypothetical protein